MSDAMRKRMAIVIGIIVIVAAAIVAVAVLIGGQGTDRPTASPTTSSPSSSVASPSSPAPSSPNPTSTTEPSPSGTSPAPTSTAPTHTDTVAKQGLRDVQSACGSGTAFAEDPAKESLVLEQDGESLTLLSGVQSDRQLFNCVVRETGMPQDVQDRIAQADYNSGLQEATWSNIKATWTVNPNSGLDLYLEPQS